MDGRGWSVDGRGRSGAWTGVAENWGCFSQPLTSFVAQYTAMANLCGYACSSCASQPSMWIRLLVSMWIRLLESMWIRLLVLCESTFDASIRLESA